MLKRYHQNIGGIFRVVDAAVIGTVWLLSYLLRFYVPIIEVTKGFPSFESYAALTPFIVVLWSMVFSSMRVYTPKRMLRRTQEAYLLLKAHGVSMLLFIAMTYMFSEYKYSRVVMIYFGLIGGFFLIFFRLALRNLLRSLRKRGFRLKRVLIVGEGALVEDLIFKLNRFPELGLQVVGLTVDETSATKEVLGRPVLGKFEDIIGIIRSNNVDQVLISLPRNQSSRLDQILSLLKDEPIDLQVVPFVTDFIALGCEVEDFDGLPIINLNDSPLFGWGAALKRLTDMLVSLLALTLLSPVYLIIAGLVRLSSKGPILFGQERMGLDGTTFKMYKFRSMKVGAEDQTGAIWAQKDDDRKTAVGSFLRATSLDEIPQFWNVLKGDMTLVGPRPERPVFVKQFRSQIPNYMLRHKVRAGITGWAQINGWRGNTSLKKRIEFDLYYIKHWSYVFDLKILLMTFWKGFINKNAY